MLSLIPLHRKKILEIGCAEGTFAKSIDGAEEIWGVEPDAQAAVIASRRLSNVLNGTFESTKQHLPFQYFDVVVCNDVIEHMPDHDEFLSQVREYIVPNGCLIGSLPNIRYYWSLFDLVLAKDWKYEDTGILDRTHLRFFTEKSLRRSLSYNGFVIEELRGIKKQVTRAWSKKSVVYSVTALSAIALTLGYFKDIRFLQFAFRASLNPTRKVIA